MLSSPRTTDLCALTTIWLTLNVAFILIEIYFSWSFDLIHLLFGKLLRLRFLSLLTSIDGFQLGLRVDRIIIVNYSERPKLYLFYFLWWFARNENAKSSLIGSKCLTFLKHCKIIAMWVYYHLIFRKPPNCLFWVML